MTVAHIWGNGRLCESARGRRRSAAAGARHHASPPPTPLGAYVEAVTIGNLVYLSGMLAVAGRETPFVGRVGVELTVEQGRQAAEVASLNALSAVREYLGSLDKVSRVVKLGVYIATAGDFREHPIVADGASEMLVNVFGEEKLSGRIVLGVAVCRSVCPSSSNSSWKSMLERCQQSR